MLLQLLRWQLSQFSKLKQECKETPLHCFFFLFLSYCTFAGFTHVFFEMNPNRYKVLFFLAIPIYYYMIISFREFDKRESYSK